MLDVAALVIYKLMLLRAQRGEMHFYSECFDENGECGLCGKPLDDPIHVPPSEDGSQ